MGGAGTVAFGAGETMILAATLLWAAEVVLVKRLLDVLAPRPLAAAWMAPDVRPRRLARLHGPRGRPAGARRRATGWAAWTGLLLAGYVASWYAALARAQAVDVTAVLVFGAVVTALIANAADGAALDPVGLILVTAGAALIGLAALRRSAGRWPHRDRGPLLFARYAYPLNAPGLCGADETRMPLEYGSAGVSDGGLAELARTFEGREGRTWS